VAKDLKPVELRRLARLGALQRLTQLRQETATILKAFPDLRGGVGQGGAKSASSPAAPKRRRKGRRMTAAQRRAVSERMKKFWAERRKAR
jgi:hypothetical protein